MVDQQLGVDAEQLIQQIFVVKLRVFAHGTPGDIPHGAQSHLFQLLRIAGADPPEIRQGAVRPQLLPVAQLVQLGDAHAILVRRNVLRHNVHGHLGKVQICPDPGGGRDAGVFQNVQNDLHGKLLRGHAVELQVICSVNEHLVDGVGVDVLRGDVFEVNIVDGRAGLHIKRHLRGRDDVVDLQFPVLAQFIVIVGFAGEGAPGSGIPAQCVDLPDLLHHLEQSGAAGDAEGFQGRGDRKADGFVGAAGVGHHQIGGHGVQPPLDALHGGVEGF